MKLQSLKTSKRFESIQNNFSMLNRRFMDELAQVCQKENISLLPYSPLAGGVLTGKYNQKFVPSNARFAKYINSNNPRIQAQAKRFVNDKTLTSTEKYLEIAQKYNVNLTTLATAWSMQFDYIASTIIGATTAKQLDDTLAAFDYNISAELNAELDKVHHEILYPMG